MKLFNTNFKYQALRLVGIEAGKPLVRHCVRQANTFNELKKEIDEGLMIVSFHERKQLVNGNWMNWFPKGEIVNMTDDQGRYINSEGIASRPA
jgi:hypothetical protein